VLVPSKEELLPVAARDNEHSDAWIYRFINFDSDNRGKG
jgi:hypothetical protein